MKILAVSGGTRNGSNDAMAREALMGAKEAGAEIEFIRLFDLELKPCTGCIACVNGLMSGANGDCVLKDDVKWLDEKLLEADGVIWVMPIFEKGVPAIMRIVQDRLFGPSHDTGTNMVAGKISEQTGKGDPDQRKFKKKATSFIAIWCRPGQSAPSAEDMAASAHMNVPDAQEKVRFPERCRCPYHSRPGSRGIMQWWFLWRDSA